MVIINESGLYAYILSSKLEQAAAVEHTPNINSWTQKEKGRKGGLDLRKWGFLCFLAHKFLA